MFISKFKHKENKNIIKKLKDEIKQIKLQLTNQIMMIILIMMIRMVMMIMIKSNNNNHKHQIKIKKYCKIIKNTLKTGKKLEITYR